MINEALLVQLGLAKGDKPMSDAVFNGRVNGVYRFAWARWARDLAEIDPTVAAAKPDWLGAQAATLAEARIRRGFNRDLAKYRKAVARLARHSLAEGREGQIIEEPLESQWDAVGNPVVNRTVIEAIPPLVAEDTEYPVLDTEGVPTGETVTEPNREVQARLDNDAEERAAAQAVIIATPQEVKDFDAG